MPSLCSMSSSYCVDLVHIHAVLELSNDFEADAFVKLTVTFGGLSGKPVTSQPQENLRVMLTTESLCLSLDNANREIQCLELRIGGCERGIRSKWSIEVQRLKELYKQVLEDICKGGRAGKREHTPTGGGDEESPEPRDGSPGGADEVSGSGGDGCSS